MEQIRFASAEVTTADGKKMKLKLKDPEDFLNDVVKPGTEVVLIMKNWKVAKGELLMVEDDGSDIYIYLRDIGDVNAHLYKYDYVMAYSDGR